MADITVSVAEAKRSLCDLLGRVAYAGTHVVITKRSRPVAMLVPAKKAMPPRSLADVKGWLEDDDPFFAAIAEIERNRVKSMPRVFREAGAAYGHKRKPRKHA